MAASPELPGGGGTVVGWAGAGAGPRSSGRARTPRFGDPDHLEFPAEYHHRRARARFDQLAQRLDADFGCRCVVDRHVEDASLHGRIEIPAAHTASRHQLVVFISNFGGLAVVAVDRAGAWTDIETADVLHPDDADRIAAALDDLEYTRIPEEPLWRRYDGTWNPDAFRPSAATWWIRYFDYL